MLELQTTFPAAGARTGCCKPAFRHSDQASRCPARAV